MTDGTNRTLRLDGDHVYVDTEVAGNQKQLGAFSLAELTKSGSEFTGKLRVQFVCGTTSRWDGRTTNHSWVFEVEMAITLFTPSRIEGWARDGVPKGMTFDCSKGKYSGLLVRRGFVWIPAGK